MTIHQGLEKMLTSDTNHKSNNEKASTVQITLDNYFSKKSITLILNMPNILNYSVLNITFTVF